MSVLFEKELLVVNPQLAELIGLNEAIILQQMHYWQKKSDKKIDGRVWIYNSASQWREQFKFFSESTIKRAIYTLEKLGIIFIGNYNKDGRDRTKWYSINYSELDKLVNDATCQNERCNVSNCTDATCQNDTMTIYTEITTETTTENIPPNPQEGESGGITKKQNAITFKTWLSNCKERGETPIPEDDAVFKNAEKSGLPIEFVALEWAWFKESYQSKTKRHSNWRRVFMNAVNGVWGGLWWFDVSTKEYKLTSKGHQFKNRVEAEEALNG